ncbi:unnamed protein product, partial [Vitis vinifera]
MESNIVFLHIELAPFFGLVFVGLKAQIFSLEVILFQLHFKL